MIQSWVSADQCMVTDKKEQDLLDLITTLFKIYILFFLALELQCNPHSKAVLEDSLITVGITSSHHLINTVVAAVKPPMTQWS